MIIFLIQIFVCEFVSSVRSLRFAHVFAPREASCGWDFETDSCGSYQISRPDVAGLWPTASIFCTKRVIVECPKTKRPNKKLPDPHRSSIGFLRKTPNCARGGDFEFTCMFVRGAFFDRVSPTPN